MNYGNAFRISFHLDWQIYNGIFNSAITARSQILVHRWGPEQQHGFADGLNQSLVSSVVQATVKHKYWSSVHCYYD